MPGGTAKPSMADGSSLGSQRELGFCQVAAGTCLSPCTCRQGVSQEVLVLTCVLIFDPSGDLRSAEQYNPKYVWI